MIGEHCNSIAIQIRVEVGNGPHNCSVSIVSLSLVKGSASICDGMKLPIFLWL